MELSYQPWQGPFPLVKQSLLTPQSPLLDFNFHEVAQNSNISVRGLELQRAFQREASRDEPRGRETAREI